MKINKQYLYPNDLICENCKCDKQLVRKLKSDNKNMVQAQCPNCGLGSRQIKRDVVHNYMFLPLFDDYLYNETINRIREELKHRDLEYALRKEKYHKYLNSSDWKVKRDFVIKENPICYDCETNLSQEVHHLTYDRIFNEEYEDLIALCSLCHKKRHGIEI